MARKVVLLDSENRTLLIRRSKQCRNFVGTWEWPGGKADPGEDFATAAKREAQEATETFLITLAKKGLIAAAVQGGGKKAE